MIWRYFPFGRLAVFAAMAMAFPAAAEAPKEEAAVYSNLCHSAATGDLNRERLVLLSFFGGHFVIFQRTAGVLLPPDMGKARIVGDSLSFEVKPSEGPSLSFVGTVTPQEIAGQLQYSWDGGRSERRELRWKRRALDAEVLPPCGTGPEAEPQPGQNGK